MQADNSRTHIGAPPEALLDGSPPKYTDILNRWATASYAQLARREVLVVSLVLAALVALAGAFAATSPFWGDEGHIYYAAALSPRAIWQAQTTVPLPKDPPLYSWMAHYAVQLLGLTVFAARFPSVLAYGVTCLCVYCFLRRCTDLLTALFGALLTASTGIFQFAYQARPYSLLVAASAASILAWSIAAEGRKYRHLALLGLFASIAAAVSAHFFGCLILVPILCGEAARIAVRRRPDWGVLWACVGGAAVSLAYIPLIPVMWRYKANYNQGASMRDFFNSYGLALEPMAQTLAFVAIGVCVLYAATGGRNLSALSYRRPALYESAAIIPCCLLPMAGLLLGRTVSGTFATRFTIPCAVGLTFLLAATLRQVTQGRIVLLLAAVGMAAASPAYRAIDRFLALRGGGDAALYARNSAILNRFPALPIVPDSHELLFRIMVYAPDKIRSRCTYLEDRSAARILGATTVPYDTEGIRLWTGIPVAQYGEFTKSHQEFLVVTQGKGTMAWIARKLQEDGATMEFEGIFDDGPKNYFIFRVFPRRRRPSIEAIPRPGTH